VIDAKQTISVWAKKMLMHFLASAERPENKRPATVTSLFMDYAVSEDYTLDFELFATPFMRILACYISKHVNNAVMKKLKYLFGSSGMGQAFENKIIYSKNKNI
jgi:hypothetical protein